MTDRPNWRVAHLDDIERIGRDVPVREHLGIHAFGINAYTPGEDGTLIGEHDEAGSGQEELYLVLDGNATFEVDGETVDAPAGTFVVAAKASAASDVAIITGIASALSTSRPVLRGEREPICLSLRKRARLTPREAQAKEVP